MNVLVHMKATVATDGNSDWRRRPVATIMDRELITEAATLAEAISNVVKNEKFLDDVKDFEYFKIDGQIYTSDHWKSK